jgi:hypothetical protein
LAEAKPEKTEPEIMALSMAHRARGIVDLSGTKLPDRPSFLEEKMLKTRGIFSAEINAYSNRMIVEFDPTVISLEKIKAMIKPTSPT